MNAILRKSDFRLGVCLTFIFPYFVITRVSWLGAKWPLFVDRSGFVGIQLKPFGLLGWGQPIG
jgi:hypothetical protein